MGRFVAIIEDDGDSDSLLDIPQFKIVEIRSYNFIDKLLRLFSRKHSKLETQPKIFNIKATTTDGCNCLLNVIPGKEIQDVIWVNAVNSLSNEVVIC